MAERCIVLFTYLFVCFGVFVIKLTIMYALLQNDVTGLVSQLQDLHRKNTELEEDNAKLISKVCIVVLKMQKDAVMFQMIT